MAHAVVGRPAARVRRTAAVAVAIIAATMARAKRAAAKIAGAAALRTVGTPCARRARTKRIAAKTAAAVEKVIVRNGRMEDAGTDARARMKCITHARAMARSAGTAHTIRFVAAITAKTVIIRR